MLLPAAEHGMRHARTGEQVGASRFTLSVLGLNDSQQSENPSKASRTGKRLARPRGAAVIVGVVACLASVLFSAGVAWASGVEQGGNYVNSVDGTEGDVSATYVGLPTGVCMIYSQLIASSSRQLEAGLVVCAGSSKIDNTCPGTNGIFSETYISGVGYSCYPHGGWSYGTAYPVSVQKYGSGSFVSYVNGTALQSLTGFPAATNAWAWGEESGQATCNGWSGSGHFSNWKYLKNSVWNLVKTATKSPGCWTVSTVSSGAFSVSH